jgi:rare lipoprotein A
MIARTLLSFAIVGTLFAQKPSPFPARNPKQAAAPKAKAAPVEKEDESEVIDAKTIQDALGKQESKPKADPEPAKPVATPSKPVAAAPAPATPAASAPTAKTSTPPTQAVSAPAAVKPVIQQTPPPSAVPQQFDANDLCRATFYGSRADGLRTASGEALNNEDLTFAHPTLPFGTKVRLVNIGNSRVVEARVNDRNRGGEGCRINVSMRIARELGFVQQGSAMIAVQR